MDKLQVAERMAITEERRARKLARRLEELYEAVAAVGTPSAPYEAARAVMEAMHGAREALTQYSNNEL